jgi:site-specific recombinase XerD
MRGLSFCKNLIDAGVSLEKVATLAGHDNLETTRRYCTPSEQDLAFYSSHRLDGLRSYANGFENDYLGLN